MTIVAKPFALPLLAFTHLWQQVADLGEPHPILGTGYHYVLPDEGRARLNRYTWDILADYGLARNTTVNPLLKATLEAISRADREYYAWLQATDGEHGAVLVAARNNHALRLLLTNDVVAVEPISNQWLPDDLVSALPEVDAAPITATSVPSDLYNNPTYRDPRKPLAEPPDTAPVEYVKRLIAAPRDAVHQLYTASRRDGQRIRSTPLTAIDITGRGRILTYTNHDDEGNQYIHVVQGTAHNLITTLERTNHAL